MKFMAISDSTGRIPKFRNSNRILSYEGEEEGVMVRVKMRMKARV